MRIVSSATLLLCVLLLSSTLALRVPMSVSSLHDAFNQLGRDGNYVVQNLPDLLNLNTEMQGIEGDPTCYKEAIEVSQKLEPLPPLAYSREAREIAMERLVAMVKKDEFSHTLSDGSSAASILDSDYYFTTDNMAVFELIGRLHEEPSDPYQTPEQMIMAQWLADCNFPSRPHRSIMRSTQVTSFGCAYYNDEPILVCVLTTPIASK